MENQLRRCLRFWIVLWCFCWHPNFKTLPKHRGLQTPTESEKIDQPPFCCVGVRCCTVDQSLGGCCIIGNGFFLQHGQLSDYQHAHLDIPLPRAQELWATTTTMRRESNKVPTLPGIWKRSWQFPLNQENFRQARSILHENYGTWWWWWCFRVYMLSSHVFRKPDTEANCIAM